MIVHVGKNIKKVTPFRSDSVVELRDIMPTLLEFAGIDIPDTVDGISMAPEIIGEKPHQREYLHGEHSGGVQSNHYIVTSHDKYIWFSQTGREQYFNLDQDPREEHDLIHEQAYQDRIHTLRSHLIDELKDREEGYTDGRQLLLSLIHIYNSKQIH